MSDTYFTNIRSLLGALAKALNLINPEMEKHHEQTAYFSYFIGREMGFEIEDLHLAVYSALLHDVGSIVMEEKVSVSDLESNAAEYAKIGADMLMDLDDFKEISIVIRYCQSKWEDLKKELNKDNEKFIKIASIIHVSDVVSSLLNPDIRVLNQVDNLMNMVECVSGSEFNPEVIDALKKIKNNELLWLDAMANPYFLMFFTGEFHKVSLQKTAELTKLISRIIDYRSSFTAMHSAGVAAVAKKLAELSGMKEEDCIKMEIAGNLHDVGKLVVPRSILEKNGKLTDSEYNVIKEHPYYTRLVLMDIEGFEEIRDWAGFHHEKLNGRGYPFHIEPSELNKGSRIMAVADIFSAITEDRPYRAGMSKDKVIAILNEDVQRGDIDKDIVDLLINHYDEVDEIRDFKSKSEGKRYYDYIKNKNVSS